MRKYRSADAFSDQRQQQLQALEQRMEQLDHQLSVVETMIAERFPSLGMSLEDRVDNLPPAVDNLPPTRVARRTSLRRGKPR